MWQLLRTCLFLLLLNTVTPAASAAANTSVNSAVIA